jgi:tetratricopeptide (TPR) repeat protein
MPTTINGIGTHYYGKSNRSIRRGAACHSCGRVGDLQTYDTRLWFVVVFVPVIPLGRKTIIDECPKCRRHYAADQAKFAMARQLSLSGAREQFRADPTPEMATATHAQMVGFHAHDDAAAFRKEVLEQFPDDAQLRGALAEQLDQAGQYDAATPLVERAFELNPQLPEARNALALRRLVDGKLDEARALLNFMQEPGAGQLYPLMRLEQLARAYQKAGKHREALELSQHLLQELPDIGEHHKFRQFVATSEKKLGRPESMLPERGWSWRALFDSRSGRFSKGQRWAAYLSIVAALIVAGLCVLNEYRRGHRTVIVRNEFAPGATVTIDGETAVPDVSQSEIVLSEGTHHVTVKGAIAEEFDVDLETGYWQRWTHSPAWVINVGGAAPLMIETLHYAVNPRPSEFQLVVGDNLCFVPHVDYLFTTGPKRLEVGSDSNEVTKHQLSLAAEPPVALFRYALDNSSPESAIHYAENRLLLNPADDDLLKKYYTAMVERSQLERAKAFLKSQIARRPVLVGWHRMYHELHTTTAEKTALIADYDRWLAAEPNDAALLYLRGRLDPSSAEAQKFFDRSIAADAQFPWPWAALGYRACTRGDWKRARQCYDEALRRGFPEDLGSFMMLARLGLGEAAALEREYQDKLATLAPSDALPTLMLLIAVQGAQGHAAAARQSVEQWAAMVPPGELPPEAMTILRDIADLNAGDLNSVGQRVASGVASQPGRLVWLLISGKADEAAADATLANAWTDPWKALALSLALDLGGNREQAAVWREKACDALAQLGFDEVRAAELLRSPQPPELADLDEVELQPSDKAILVAALAHKFPAWHGELSAIAERLAVEPGGLSLLVHKATQTRPERGAP